MLRLLLLLPAALAGAQRTDSTYATPALRALVERAAVENRRVPSSLASYSARIESELALLFSDSLGREHNPNPQQVGGHVVWTAERGADVRIRALRTPP